MNIWHVISLFFILWATTSHAQCPNDNALTGGAVTPTCPGTTNIACVQGGQYALINVVLGNQYTFSTCAAAFDTEITVFNNTGGPFLVENDDACGLQSSVTWTATFNGQVRVLVDQYPCAANATCAPLQIVCSVAPPPLTNDDPCGAIALTVNSNCQMTTFSNAGAGATTGIPAPGCANYLGGDVWFSAVVPASGILNLEMAAGVVTDAGMAVYTAPACTGPFTLVECDDDDGPGLMAQLDLTGLAAGSTVYIRVWEYGNDNNGTFDLCAWEPIPPTGDCIYSLNLLDSFGDGWDGSQVCVTVTPPGTTNCYTVTAATNTVLIGVNIGDIISISYTSGGGFFEGEISYTLTLNGGLLFSDGPNPTTGVVYTAIVDCLPPPASPADCAGGVTICSNQTLSGNSTGTGSIVDLNASNQGCLASAEQQGNWFYFSPSTGGTIGMTISPQNAADDYDFAIWGPYVTPPCPPPGPPLRCSFAAPSGDTGLNSTSADVTEGAGGDKWVSDMNVTAGEVYILYIDNWSTSGQPFDLTWQLSNGASLDCTVLPIELISFSVDNLQVANRLLWSTASELNTDIFILQRAGDDLDFRNISVVDAAGQSNSTLFYSELDPTPEQGLNYYRLQQVDLDGQFTYSNIITTYNNTEELYINGPFQDPATPGINFNIRGPNAGTLTFDLYDLTGRNVMERTIQYSTVDNRTHLPLNSIRPGNYIYRFSDQNGMVIKSGNFIFSANER